MTTTPGTRASRWRISLTSVEGALEGHLAVSLEDGTRGVDGREEGARRRRRGDQVDAPIEVRARDEPVAHVDDGGLRVAHERLVDARDGDVGAELDRSPSPAGSPGAHPMPGRRRGGYAALVRYRGQRGHVGDRADVGGRGHEDGRDVGRHAVQARHRQPDRKVELRVDRRVDPHRAGAGDDQAPPGCCGARCGRWRPDRSGCVTDERAAMLPWVEPPTRNRLWLAPTAVAQSSSACSR